MNLDVISDQWISRKFTCYRWNHNARNRVINMYFNMIVQTYSSKTKCQGKCPRWRTLLLYCNATWLFLKQSSWLQVGIPVMSQTGLYHVMSIIHSIKTHNKMPIISFLISKIKFKVALHNGAVEMIFLHLKLRNHFVNLSIPKLKRLHRWSLGIYTLFHLTFYNGCNMCYPCCDYS